MKGLTRDEAAQRLRTHGPNELPAPPPRSLVRLVAAQVVEPLTLVLLAAGLLSLVVLGQVLEGIAILAIVALNVAMSSVQQSRADAAMASLRKLAPPMAKVVRDGALQVIEARHIVPGDVVHLAAGDRVPADLHLHEAQSLAADESMLTGESLPVEKQAPAEHALFAGTLVVRGRGHGEAHATGPATRMGKLARGLAIDTPPPLEAELRQVAWRITAAAGVAAAILLVVVLWRSGVGQHSLSQAALAAVALGVAAIPEGLLAVVTLALALGAQRMARQGTIVRRMRAIQGLGSANVLCVDKTGTLTEARLSVAASVAVAGRDAELWQAALRCNDAQGAIGDPLEVALAVEAARRGIQLDGERIAERPFQAVHRSMTTVHRTASGPIVTVKGAPESVLARCPAGPEAQWLSMEATRLTAQGGRVIAFATAAGTDQDAPLQPLGLVALQDPIRAGARPAIQAAMQAGIQVVMATGDHPTTARAVAAAVGLDATRLVTGADLAGLGQADRVARLRSAQVLARVEPETKVELVDAHRAAGDVVVMMGDGINDAPALRKADVGVAVSGQDSTDVAREAADIVLTRGDIETLVQGVREGRRIYSNLQAAVNYLIAGNASEVLVVLVGLALFPDLLVPLAAVQLLWINLLTDGLPAIALGVDVHPGDPLRGGPSRRDSLLPPRHLLALLGRGALMAMAVLATGVWARDQGWDSGQLQTQLFVTLVLIHLVMAYPSRSTAKAFGPGWWRNTKLVGAIGGSLVLQGIMLGVPALRGLLGLEALPASGFAAAAAAATVTVIVIELLRRSLAPSARTSGRA